MSATAPNWAEQVVAIATGILELGVTGAVAAAVFGAQQVRESRRSREAHMAAEFFRRWNEDSLRDRQRAADRPFGRVACRARGGGQHEGP
jgi:hypothetical protein